MPNVVSGIIVGIIALPLSIALAVAVGVAPIQGLYTAAFAGAVAAIFGGSRFNITGPTAALVPLLQGVVLKLRKVLETVRPGIVIMMPNEGRISYEHSMRCIKLIGTEVLPAMREMAKELQLNSPWDIDAPVSLAHAQGAYGPTKQLAKA